MFKQVVQWGVLTTPTEYKSPYKGTDEENAISLSGNYHFLAEQKVEVEMCSGYLLLFKIYWHRTIRFYHTHGFCELRSQTGHIRNGLSLLHYFWNLHREGWNGWSVTGCPEAKHLWLENPLLRWLLHSRVWNSDYIWPHQHGCLRDIVLWPNCIVTQEMKDWQFHPASKGGWVG